MLDLSRKQITVKSTVQALTANYADLGSEIDVVGYDTLNLYVEIDINDSQNVTFQVLSKLAGGATAEYSLPQDIAGSAKITVDKLVYEVNFDSDCYQVISVALKGANFAQVQVKAGVPGAGPGNINSCYAVLV
jgi:hypothetical protein